MIKCSEYTCSQEVTTRKDENEQYFDQNEKVRRLLEGSKRLTMYDSPFLKPQDSSDVYCLEHGSARGGKKNSLYKLPPAQRSHRVSFDISNNIAKNPINEEKSNKHDKESLGGTGIN